LIIENVDSTLLRLGKALSIVLAARPRDGHQHAINDALADAGAWQHVVKIGCRGHRILFNLNRSCFQVLDQSCLSF
jgi:hypothetical protein